MSKKNPHRIRLFSYTSSGTRFLTRGFQKVGVPMYREGPSHAPFFALKSPYSLQAHDRPLVVYGDPRLACLSLMMKRIPKRIHGCRMVKGLQHLGMTRPRILPLYNNPFLPWANNAQLSVQLKDGMKAPPPTSEAIKAWSQFDAMHVFFNSWLGSADESPCDIAFIKYEAIKEESVSKGLAAFFENHEIATPLHQFLNQQWKPRSTSLDDIDPARREFLNNHFKDLLDMQAQLPPFYILEKNNG